MRSLQNSAVPAGRNVPDYVPALDGLRGVSVLAVMAFHGRAAQVDGGFIGVDIFFVLSGFLITRLLVQEFDATGSISFRNFYMRRVLRLAPALLLLLLVFCVASLSVLSADKAHSNFIDSLIALFYLSNWARAFSIHPPDFLGHTWSLSIEEQFYLVWPLLLLLVLRGAKRPYVAVVAAGLGLLSWVLRIYLAANGASPDRLYNGSDTRADALMVGCTLGVLLSSYKPKLPITDWRAQVLRVTAACAAIGLVALLHLARWDERWMYVWGLFAVEVLAAILILDVLANPLSVIRKVMSVRWLVWVGSISYGLYLWHLPIYLTMVTMGFKPLSVLTLGTALTFLAASISYYALERPALALKRHFARNSAKIS